MEQETMTPTQRPVFKYEPPTEEKTGFPAQYYAGFWIRFMAYLIDLIVTTALSGILISPVFRLANWKMDSSFFAIYGALVTIIFLAYFIVMTKFWSQTLGKMIFGIRVISLKNDRLTWPTVIFREGALRFVTYIVWGLYIICAFTPKKQGIADLLESTAVVHEGYLKLDDNWQ
ncbi:RDD family protein [Listeria booriae]|uniref:RDD family protein n=1 Tax=Listeria booriae TaxID=1552123 RepID=UPI001629287E|nr:RDD family protein [Listeria booriae]MBC1892170.1 RDD family protein [Listeria booriae]MBC1897831.1 RDD family protein [Listeria booriae]MBC1976759.1 RDD family protein [Listeria booriae]MBC1982984.1 RDD family protein [Listeria booriae]MBC2021971.1 RDD family protein [Listeria booriae]